MRSKNKKNMKKEKEIVSTNEIDKVEVKDNYLDKDKELLERTLQGLKEESEINPDLDNFFEKIREKKDEIDIRLINKNEVNLEEPKERLEPNKKSTFGSKFKVTMLITAFIASTFYFILYLKDALNHVNYIKDIVNSASLLLIFFFIIIALIGNKKIRNMFSVFSSLIIIGVIALNILVNKDMIKLPTLKVIDDFTNTTIADVMKWASANNIDVKTEYEYSDNVEEGNVIVQDVEAGSVLKLIDEITVTVSNGPNYDKELVLSSWVGRNVDELIEYINTNHLNNVNITFTTNNDVEKDQIISQSTKGEIKRNTSISFAVSLGNASSLKDIKLENLVKKSLFDATFYLKRNGVKYNLTYEFSSKVKAGYVISQDPKEGTKISPSSDTVNLVISKGKEIVVPEFNKATVDEVVEWIIENNLKVVFAEKYSTTIDKDKLVSVSVKTGDSIIEGTKITVTTSKGALKVATFSSLAEFRSWASDNGVSYSEKYEYNDSVGKGQIINLSIKSGEKIDPQSQSITVTVSYGSAVVVPYFVGSSRSSIQSTCNNKGLNCTFYYVGYNSNSRDTALSQNVSSGTKVVSGTYISIGLSSGPAQRFNIYLNSELFGGSYSSTVSSLRNYLNNNAPGVTFNFVPKTANSCVPGLIHPDSPIKGGVWNTVTQGNTYTIWIMDC
jgi:beta-lactam-binding protein with PASTA domain